MTISFQNGTFLSGTATSGSLTTSGKTNISSFMNTDYLDNKYEYYETKESYETKSTSEDSSIETEITNFLYLLETGYEDKAMESYSDLIATMSEQTQYSTLSDDELQAAAKKLIDAQLEEETEGEYNDIKDYIVDNTADADKQYMQKVWFKNSKVDSTTTEDLLDTVCNINADDTVSTGTKVKGVIAFLPSLFTQAFDALFGAKHH